MVTKFVKFHNVTEKESPKKAKGVYLVKKRGQIATRLTWAFQILPPEGGCFAWASWVASSYPILL